MLVTCRSIDGPGKVLAETELPCGGQKYVRMWFDVGENWSDAEFFQVGAHEFGHAIGIGHAPQGTPNLMQPFLDMSIKACGPWDLAEELKRYPKRVPTPAPPAGPIPPAPPAPHGGGIFVDEATVKAAIQKALDIAGWVAKATTPTWDDAAVTFLRQDWVVNLLVMLFSKFGNDLGSATPKAIEEAVIAHFLKA